MLLESGITYNEIVSFYEFYEHFTHFILLSKCVMLYHLASIIKSNFGIEVSHQKYNIVILRIILYFFQVLIELVDFVMFCISIQFM